MSKAEHSVRSAYGIGPEINLLTDSDTVTDHNTYERATDYDSPSHYGIRHKTKTSSLDRYGQKKLIISFSGQFFQKLMRQGGFIFYFLLLQIRKRVLIFFPAKV